MSVINKDHEGGILLDTSMGVCKISIPPPSEDEVDAKLKELHLRDCEGRAPLSSWHLAELCVRMDRLEDWLCNKGVI